MDTPRAAGARQSCPGVAGEEGPPVDRSRQRRATVARSAARYSLRQYDRERARARASCRRKNRLRHLLRGSASTHRWVAFVGCAQTGVLPFSQLTSDSRLTG